MTGRWIALEGGEGCGKSTQARILAEARGAVLTREPGGTPVGRSIRQLLLDPATVALDARAEALLMAADRAQHVREVVLPALNADRDVVSDRSAWSSLAYQGYGRKLGVDEVKALCDYATDGRWPDLALLLDVPPATATDRMGAARDRLEAEGDGFHSRVAEGFRALVADHPDSWVLIDGVGSVEAVSARIAAAVSRRWPT